MEPEAFGVTIELLPDPDLGGFTARVPDIPAYGEGDTADAAIEDLREALRAYIETFGLDDALARVNCPAELRRSKWSLTDLAHA